MSTNNVPGHISVESGHELDIDRSYKQNIKTPGLKTDIKDILTEFKLHSSQQILVSAHYSHPISKMPPHQEYRFEDSPGLGKLITRWAHRLLLLIQ